MDESTKAIPVLTYTSEYDGQAPHPWTMEATDGDLLQAIPSGSMN
jgi:hypothetical protein